MVPTERPRKTAGWSRRFHWLLCAAGALSLSACAHFHDRPIAAQRLRQDFARRSLEAPELRTFIETNLGRPVAKWPLKSWDIETLTLAAYFYHPSLDVARAEWETARAASVTAGGRPNPTVSFSPGYDFSAAGGMNPWIPGANFDLPVETAGKRGKRIAKAEAQGEVARQNLFTAAWKVRAEVRDSLTQYRNTSSLAGNLEHQHTLRKQLVELLEQRLKAGEASQAEVSPARLALEKTRLEWDLAKEAEATAWAKVAQAIGVPVRALTDLPMEIGLYSPQLSDAQLNDMRERALQLRADIRAALAEYDAAQQALRLEIAKQYPDVHLGTGYQWDQGDHKWNLGLSMELPVLNQNQGPIAEATAHRAELAARFVALQANISSEIDKAIHTFQTARARIFTTKQMFDAQKRQEDLVSAQAKAGAADKLDLATLQLERLQTVALNNEVSFRAELAINQLEDVLQLPLDRRAGASAPPPEAFIETAPRPTNAQP